jgi:HEAT repeat protein
MEVTFEQLREELQADEPEYRRLAELGRDALPHLRVLVDSGDPDLGAKAAYLAGRIGDADAVPILEAAAGSSHPNIRAAAAGGARHLPGNSADSVVLLLIDDDWAGIRKSALRAVPDEPGPELARRVDARRTLEPEASVRDLAGDVFARLPPAEEAP